MRRPIFKIFAGFCLLALLLVVAVVVATVSGPAPPPAPLPSPNGYDDFIAAGKMIVGSSSDYPTMTTNELRAFVLTNAEPLKLVRLGLSRNCQVPLGYSGTNMSDYGNPVAIKQLVQTLAAQGRLAELENRPQDAGDAYLAGIRLGQESVRGGLVINSLVGAAVEAISTTRMEAALNNFDARQCRELAGALESAESRRESPATILKREREWVRHTFGLKGQFQLLIDFRSIQKMEQTWKAKVTAQQNRTQALTVKLASRAYELEKGKRPLTVSALVPEYLKAVPQVSTAATNALSRP